MLIPMVLATPKKAWKIAGVATVGSVLGGYFGYIIGVYFFDLIAKPVLDFMAISASLRHFRDIIMSGGPGLSSGPALRLFPIR